MASFMTVLLCKMFGRSAFHVIDLITVHDVYAMK